MVEFILGTIFGIALSVCLYIAKKKIITSKKENVLEKNISCIICKKPSNGKHFCYDCYSKYKTKSIELKVINCKDTQIIDPYGNKNVVCEDGTKVRSRAEALVCNFLYSNKIRYIYEKEVFYNENGIDKTLHPDFYLPDYDVYIEYNEIKKEAYRKSKEYTQNIYSKLGFKIIVMNENDLNNIAGCLKPKLGIN